MSRTLIFVRKPIYCKGEIWVEDVDLDDVVAPDAPFALLHRHTHRV